MPIHTTMPSVGSIVWLDKTSDESYDGMDSVRAYIRMGNSSGPLFVTRIQDPWFWGSETSGGELAVKFHKNEIAREDEGRYKGFYREPLLPS